MKKHNRIILPYILSLVVGLVFAGCILILFAVFVKNNDIRSGVLIVFLLLPVLFGSSLSGFMLKRNVPIKKEICALTAGCGNALTWVLILLCLIGFHFNKTVFLIPAVSLAGAYFGCMLAGNKLKRRRKRR